MRVDLLPLEYQILKYVSQFDSVSKADIIAHFAEIDCDAVELHLRTLAEPLYCSYAHGIPNPIPMSSYLSEFCYPEVRYKILPKGKAALVDYEQRKALEEAWYRKDLIFKIATVTAAVIAAVAGIISAIANIF